MTIDIPQRAITSHDPGRTGPIPRQRDDDTMRALKLGMRYRYSLQLADFATLTASAFIGAVALSNLSPNRAGALGFWDVAIASSAMAVALHLHGLYRRPAARLRPSEWWRPAAVARCLPTAALIALAVDAVILRGGRMTLTAAVAMTLSAVVLVPLGRRLVVRTCNPTVSRILVVGTGPISERLTARLRRCPDTLVVGHVDDNAKPGTTVLGGLADLPDVCAANQIDRVIIAFPNTSDAMVLDALRRLQGRVPISEIPRYFELHNWRSESEELHGLTLTHLPTASLGLSARILKRLIDLTLATTALLIASPVMLAVAAAIKLDTPGPISSVRNASVDQESPSASSSFVR